MATIEFPSSWTEELHAYAARLQDEAVQAATKASEYLYGRVVAKAKLDPAWQPLTDNIEVWSADGKLVIGVRDVEMRSQAFALEFGDEVRPPIPLFRALAQDVRRAGEVMQEHMESVYGPGVRW